MSEERQNERDSQLSAMFDGELSGAECELLARRLARDESLRGQWSRYALIGAAVRAERGVRLDDRVARRVQSALAQEPAYGDSAGADAAVARSPVTGSTGAGSARVSAYERWLRFARPVAGASIAAGVAAVSILWMRTQDDMEPAVLASVTPAETIVLESEPVSTTLALNTAQPEPEPVSNGEPERYSTPAPSSQTNIAPPARFANYVVAHSEYSGPLTRRMALLGIVGAEAQADTAEASESEPGAAAGAADAP